MKYKWIIISLVIIVLFLVGKTITFTGKIVAEEKDIIKIGAIYQETGAGAPWGTKAINGLNLAVQEINNNGGINGNEVKIVYEDSKSNPLDALNAMNKLNNLDDVNIILAQQSSVVMALSSVANDNQIILMDTGSTTPSYISYDDYTFRTSYSANYFANAIANMLNSDDVNKIGLLYINNDYGIGMFDKYKKIFNGEIYAESFSNEETDFRTQLAKIKENNPEVLIYASGPTQSGIILKQIGQMGFNKTIYTDAYTIEYASVLQDAGEYAEGVIYISQYYNINSSEVKDFNSKYKEKYEEDSNPLSAQTYDGMMVVADAMKNCKDFTNSTCIKEKLFIIQNFSGVISNISFDKYGEIVERPVMIKTIKDGQFVLYE